MTRTIAFVNQKGGVGKTTSTINVAACLAKQNIKTCIIDMDPQANVSQIFSSINDSDPSIYNSLMHIANKSSATATHEPAIHNTYIENLSILPANVLLSSAEIELVATHGRETVLKRLINSNQSIFSSFDYILIDCQPSLGLLTLNSIIASHYLMVPLHADVFSLTGLSLLCETVQSLQKTFEINTTICGFFFTQVNKQESLFKESYELCKTNYESLVFDTFISNNVTIDHANAMDQSIIDFKPDCRSAIDYQNLTTEMLSKV